MSRPGNGQFPSPKLPSPRTLLGTGRQSRQECWQARSRQHGASPPACPLALPAAFLLGIWRAPSPPTGGHVRPAQPGPGDAGSPSFALAVCLKHHLPPSQALAGSLGASQEALASLSRLPRGWGQARFRRCQGRCLPASSLLRLTIQAHGRGSQEPACPGQVTGVRGPWAGAGWGQPAQTKSNPHLVTTWMRPANHVTLSPSWVFKLLFLHKSAGAVSPDMCLFCT